MVNITITKSCPYISPPCISPQKSAYERIQAQGLYSEVYGIPCLDGFKVGKWGLKYFALVISQ